MANLPSKEQCTCHYESADLCKHHGPLLRQSAPSSNERFDQIRKFVELNRQNGVSSERRYNGDAYADRVWLFEQLEQARNGFDSLNGAYEALRQRFEKACGRISQLESSAHETSGDLKYMVTIEPHTDRIKMDDRLWMIETVRAALKEYGHRRPVETIEKCSVCDSDRRDIRNVISRAILPPGPCMAVWHDMKQPEKATEKRACEYGCLFHDDGSPMTVDPQCPRHGTDEDPAVYGYHR